MIQKFDSRLEFESKVCKNYEEIAKNGRKLDMDVIAGEVCKSFKIHIDDIKSAARHTQFVLPRAFFSALCRDLTLESYNSIGNYLGGRDHATIIHSVNNLPRYFKKYAALKPIYETMKQSLNGTGDISLTPMPSEMIATLRRLRGGKINPNSIRQIKLCQQEEKLKEIERQRQFDIPEKKVKHLPDSKGYSYKSHHA